MTREEALEHLSAAITHIIALDDDRMNIATMTAGESPSDHMVEIGRAHV